MPILEIRDLVKTYATPDGDVHRVLDVPSFDLEPGAQVALEGGSGTGKTTFLHVIAGILRADSGSVRLAGSDMQALSEGERDAVRARHVGYVFQSFNLLHGYTALENVELAMMFGRGVDSALARSLLERVGLGDRLHYRPGRLSVGQQQRVAVARALANRPELVLADEPTGNLDRRNAREALSLIRDLCRDSGSALLLVSHDHEILGSFDVRKNLADINRAARDPNGDAEADRAVASKEVAS